MFAYENVSPRAAPVNPKIIRIRSDLSWEDVLLSEPFGSSLNGTPILPPPRSFYFMHSHPSFFLQFFVVLFLFLFFFCFFGFFFFFFFFVCVFLFFCFLFFVCFICLFVCFFFLFSMLRRSDSFLVLSKMCAHLFTNV
jgi:hypothetical protein